MVSLSAQEGDIVAGQASVPEVASSRRSILGCPSSEMGQSLHIDEVRAESALHPIVTGSLHRSE